VEVVVDHRLGRASVAKSVNGYRTEPCFGECFDSDPECGREKVHPVKHYYGLPIRLAYWCYIHIGNPVVLSIQTYIEILNRIRVGDV